MFFVNKVIQNHSSNTSKDTCRYRVIPEGVIDHDENNINELKQCLTEKWDHFMPLPAYFQGKLII